MIIYKDLESVEYMGKKAVIKITDPLNFLYIFIKKDTIDKSCYPAEINGNVVLEKEIATEDEKEEWIYFRSTSGTIYQAKTETLAILKEL